MVFWIFLFNISSQFISAPEPFNQPNVICDFYGFLTPEVASGSQSALGSQHHGLRDGKRSGAQEVNGSPLVNGVEKSDVGLPWQRRPVFFCFF